MAGNLRQSYSAILCPSMSTRGQEVKERTKQFQQQQHQQQQQQEQNVGVEKKTVNLSKRRPYLF